MGQKHGLMENMMTNHLFDCRPEDLGIGIHFGRTLLCGEGTVTRERTMLSSVWYAVFLSCDIWIKLMQMYVLRIMKKFCYIIISNQN